jgi:hypothetical protein
MPERVSVSSASASASASASVSVAVAAAAAVEVTKEEARTQGYREIGDVVKIAGRKDPKVNIFKLVHDWLRASETRWLIILDNIDDAGFLIKHQPVNGGQSSDSSDHVARRLREYLPQSQNGSILIATGNREAARKIVDVNDIIPVTL